MRLLSTQVKICQIPYSNFETTSQFLFKFCISLQFHEKLFLCTFLAQTIYTLLKSSPLKRKFLRLSSARVKFCQMPYANFETTSQFRFKFCIPLQFHERLFICTLVAHTIYTLIKGSPLKNFFWDFRVLGSNFIKFLMPILKRRVDSSTNFVSLFSFMKDYSSVLF